MIFSSHGIYLVDLSDGASTQLKLQTSRSNTLRSPLLSKIPTLISLKERPRNTKTTTVTLPSNPKNQPTLPSTQYPKREFSWSAVQERHTPPVSRPPTSPRFMFPVCTRNPPLSLARAYLLPWSRHARNRRRYRRRLFPKKPREGNLVSYWNTFGWWVTKTGGGGSVDDPTGLRVLRAEKEEERPLLLKKSRFELTIHTSNSWSLHVLTQPKSQTRCTSHAMCPRIGQRCKRYTCQGSIHPVKTCTFAFSSPDASKTPAVIMREMAHHLSQSHCPPVPGT